jgi:hypothetical protein
MADVATGDGVVQAAESNRDRVRRLVFGPCGFRADKRADPAEHARCAADPSGNAAAIESLRERLARFATAFPEVRYIYTMAPLPETPTSGVVQFICDASSERDLDQDGIARALHQSASTMKRRLRQEGTS